jgi:predicted CoA-binding protein
VKVFISYSTSDQETATRVFQALTAAGADVFQFGRSETLGKRAWEEIAESIDVADVFVVLISASAIASKNVKQEVGHAVHLQQEFASDRPRIVVAMLEDGVKPFTTIRVFNRLNLKDFDAAMARLVEQLGLRRPPKTPEAVTAVGLPDKAVSAGPAKDPRPEPDVEPILPGALRVVPMPMSKIVWSKLLSREPDVIKAPVLTASPIALGGRGLRFEWSGEPDCTFVLARFLPFDNDGDVVYQGAAREYSVEKPVAFCSYRVKAVTASGTESDWSNSVRT